MKQLLICGLGLLMVLDVVGQMGTDITFKMSNATPGEIYLGYHRAEQKFVQDTLSVDESGVLNIKKDEGYRPGLYFLYQPNSFYQEFIINEETLSLEGNGQDYNGFIANGSKENQVFKEFQLILGDLQRKRGVLIDSLNGLTGEDSVALQGEIVKLSEESENARIELYQQNPDLLISKMIRLMTIVSYNTFEDIEDEKERRIKQYQAYRNAFKERLDFTDPGLLRTPVFKANVLKYVKEVIPQIPDSLKVELDGILQASESDPVSFRYWLVTFTNDYQNSTIMGMDAVLVHLLKNYWLNGKADWANEESLKKMREEVAFLEPNQIGKKAPELKLVDTTFLAVDPINELTEDYLVLYFYDPDCGHCKKKTPVLLDAYYDLKDLGAEVVAICGVTDVKKWKNYVKENELDWVNLSDPYSQSRFRLEYDIRSFPRVYVLDKERKIVAKRIDVEQVKDFITNHKALTAEEAPDSQ